MAKLHDEQTQAPNGGMGRRAAPAIRCLEWQAAGMLEQGSVDGPAALAVGRPSDDDAAGAISVARGSRDLSPGGQDAAELASMTGEPVEGLGGDVRVAFTADRKWRLAKGQELVDDIPGQVVWRLSEFDEAGTELNRWELRSAGLGPDEAAPWLAMIAPDEVRSLDLSDW